jgi:hypothetical protein
VVVRDAPLQVIYPGTSLHTYGLRVIPPFEIATRRDQMFIAPREAVRSRWLRIARCCRLAAHMAGALQMTKAASHACGCGRGVHASFRPRASYSRSAALHSSRPRAETSARDAQAIADIGYGEVEMLRNQVALLGPYLKKFPCGQLVCTSKLLYLLGTGKLGNTPTCHPLSQVSGLTTPSPWHEITASNIGCLTISLRRSGWDQISTGLLPTS